ncbi:MAG: hypothetical protein ABI193_26370 [Minicystis sp.]
MTIALLSWAAPALADVSAENRAAAQVLFDQGKEFAKNNKFNEACPKFEESQRLDPRISTQFKLADCFEHIGKTASAWANFLDVAGATKAAGQADREQVARDRAATIEKKLSRLSIHVDAATTAGLKVLRDGSEVGHALWDTAVPIDPGQHRLVASAPGKLSWEGTFNVGAPSANVTMTIPPLNDAPVVLTPPPVASPGGPGTLPGTGGSSPPDRPDRPMEGGSTGTTQRIVGGVVGVVGLAGIAVGTVFGLQAKSKLDNSQQFCRTKLLCTEQGLTLNNDAKSAATISTIGFITGGAALATGVVFFFTAPSRPAPQATITPLLGPQVAGLGATGVW